MHAQGVIHRDIKPDNLLLSDDDVLKIVDFGVSEMFEKTDTMMTAKSAGSPAFLPPELCVAHHGDVSGKAADIWSMGVTLYCLRYGRIPFERLNVMEMYEAIRTERPAMPPDEGAEFADLLDRLLEKDPRRRIKMEELRVRGFPPFPRHVSQKTRVKLTECRNIRGLRTMARTGSCPPRRTAPTLSGRRTT